MFTLYLSSFFILCQPRPRFELVGTPRLHRADIIDFGYARIAAKNCVFYNNKAVTDLRSKYDVCTFGSSCRDASDLDLYQFQRKLKDTVKISQKWRGDKKTYMEHFGSNRWMSMPWVRNKLNCVADHPSCRDYSSFFSQLNLLA